jgi:hypothetical protein
MNEKEMKKIQKQREGDIPEVVKRLSCRRGCGYLLPSFASPNKQTNKKTNQKKTKQTKKKQIQSK